MKTKTIRPSALGVWPTLPNGVHDISLSNGTRFDVVLHKEEGKLAIGIVGRGCYLFNIITAHTSYVAEKLGLIHYLGDAAIMADLINDQWGTPGETKRQGEYQSRFCESVSSAPVGTGSTFTID